MTQEAGEPLVGEEPLERVEQEEGVEAEVAGGEAAGLGEHAVEPGEAHGLHPLGGVTFASGVNIEGEADIKEPALAEAGFGPVAEALLLGGAEADPDEVGGGGVDFIEDGGPVGVGEVAVVGAGDGEGGVEFFDGGDEVGEAVFGGAEEVVAGVGGGVFQAAVHELGAVNAVGHEGVPGGEVDAPGEGHAIGDEVLDARGGGTEVGVGEPEDEDVGVCEIGDGGRLRGGPVKLLGQPFVGGGGEFGLAE